MFLTNCLVRNLSPDMKDSIPMYIAEFVGSILVTATFGLVTQPNVTFYSAKDVIETQGSFIAPVAVGFVMISLIYTFGHISGAHFNPSITIAVYIRGFITMSDALIFMIVQLIGSFIGALLSWLISNQIPYIEPGRDTNGNQYGLGRCFIVELIYTFIITIVVINVATTELQRGNFFYGVSIGMAVCAAMAAGQRISGGAYNPAIGTALSITNVIRKGGTIKYIWIYWIAPCLGATCGGLSYHVLNIKEIDRERDNEKQQNQSLM